MKNQLNIALIQTALVWESPEKNQQLFNSKIDAIAADVDLIILPEMFTSGFTMNAALVAETMTGKTLQWLKLKAAEKNAAIIGSLVIFENNNYYNRLVCVAPNGSVMHYNKRHLFTLAGEQKVYSAGTEKIVFNYLGWKICPLICYDLRFPVWARNTEDYDILIYVANWPKPRINAWNALLKARAIENMSYCIGVNRVGLDGNNYEYPGHSAAYDVLGNGISSISENEEKTEIIILDKIRISENRSRFKFLDDKDVFKIENY